jgi:hypothetical protein
VAARKSTKAMTVNDYVRQNQGAPVNQVLRSVVVRRRYCKRLPFKAEPGAVVFGGAIVQLFKNGHYRLFTNDMAGLEAAMGMGMSPSQLESFEMFKGIQRWAAP